MSTENALDRRYTGLRKLEEPIDADLHQLLLVFDRKPGPSLGQPIQATAEGNGAVCVWRNHRKSRHPTLWQRYRFVPTQTVLAFPTTPFQWFLEWQHYNHQLSSHGQWFSKNSSSSFKKKNMMIVIGFGARPTSTHFLCLITVWKLRTILSIIFLQALCWFIKKKPW